MPLTTFAQYQVFAAAGTDTDIAYDVIPQAMRIDLSVFDQSLLFTFSPDLTHFTQVREIQAGVIGSIDIIVRKFTVRNKVAGSPGRFNMIAWYDPVEIIGRPFIRQP